MAAADPGAAGPRAVGGSGRELPNVFAVMEDVNDKLKLLNYEEGILKKRTDLKPLSRTYFALAGKPSEQFPYFAQIAVWALQQTGVDMEWSEWDDPTQTVTTICDHLRRLQFPFLADFPAAKLRSGSGDGVVCVLDFLLDRVLESRGFRVGQPVYADAGDAGAPSSAGGGADDDDDEIGDDTIEDDLPAEEEAADAGEAGAGADDHAIDPEEEDRKALEAKVNPAEWALELERVGPLLKFRSTPANKEWRTHLEQAQKHGQAISESFPLSKAALEKIGASLRKSADRISAKERSLNKEFEHLGSEFRSHQATLDSMQEAYATVQKEVAELQRDLAEKTDAIETAKLGVSERNNSMTDVSPLRRLTTSLSTLKKELQAMELRIGVVAHTLLQAKLKAQHHHHHSKASEKGR